MKKILIGEILVLVLLLGVAAWLVIGAQPEQLPTLSTEIETLPTTQAATGETVEATTEAATQATTEVPTEPSTEPSTEPPTEPPTEPIVATWMTFSDSYTIQARRYFVYDVNAGEFLITTGSDQRVYPASITKLFTCYVAMQYLSADTIVTVGDEMNLVAWDSSVAGLVKGDRLSVAQLVEGLLLPSGNDAAYVLAANAGRVICGDPYAGYKSAVQAFVDKMNELAPQVGMTDSHFCNPDGIHNDNHYMSLNDLAVLGKLSVENPTVMEVTKIVKDRVMFTYTVDRGEDYYYYGLDSSGYMNWKNTNSLIDEASEYYCPYATGLKTGLTSAAGSCLLSSFEVQGRTLIVGVFGGVESVARFRDSLYLFNKAIGVQ